MNTQNKKDYYIDVREVASILCTTTGAVQKLVQRGKLRAYKPLKKLLFKFTDIQNYVESTILNDHADTKRNIGRHSLGLKENKNDG